MIWRSRLRVHRADRQSRVDSVHARPRLASAAAFETNLGGLTGSRRSTWSRVDSAPPAPNNPFDSYYDDTIRKV
jgi:hypothetical protein